MGRRDPKHVLRRHEERLLALNDHMQHGQYHLALEFMRRVLGDPQLPPETRIMVLAQQATALLALGRTAEAIVSAERLETTVCRHRLRRLHSQISSIIERARETRRRENAS